MPKREKFGVTDHSITAPLLLKYVSLPLIKIVPAGYSPNALTLSGGFFAALSIGVIWFFGGEMRSGSIEGMALMMLSAISLVIYGVFDQLDGMQARKLQQSSPFGDFLDHWVDALIANAYTVPVMVLLEIDPVLIWLMAFVTALAFWAHNWETKNSNYRDLPVVGGLESIWTAFTIMTLTSIFGIQVWQAEFFPGIDLRSVFYWCGLAALLWVVFKALTRSHEKIIEYTGFFITLAPMSFWILTSHFDESRLLYHWAAYMTLGMMAALMTGRLMRHQWLGEPYPLVDWISFTGGVLLCVPGSVIAGGEEIILSSFFAVTVGRVLWQGFLTYRQMN